MMPRPRSASSSAGRGSSSSAGSSSPDSSPSLASSTSDAAHGSREQFDEAFLPRIVSIFFAIFHPTEGPKVLYQVPEGTIGVDEGGGGDEGPAGLFDFKHLSDYIIPKAPLCGRLVTCNGAGHASGGTRQTFKVLGHPVVLVDEAKYPRNNFIFNLAFVFDGRADVRAYEAVVRKCARQLKELELNMSFLSSPTSQKRMHGIIEQMFEDLNSYCESFIALPEAPHTRYLAVADDEKEGQRLPEEERRPEEQPALVGSLAAAPMLAPGKREPPHGLGRTVREAINLKLFNQYANPPRVQDWEVPVALLNVAGRVDDNWDLTMARVLPFVDGVNHVKRIAQLADADLELTRQCIEHLLYYGCVMTLDTFQFSNMYATRPQIAQLADGESIIAECAAYVTRPGYPLPSWPELLRLYAALRPGITLAEWIEDEEVDRLGIDVRRFVTFATIKGFLRRVHRYPVLLPSSSKHGGDGDAHRSRERSADVLRASPSHSQSRSPAAGRAPRGSTAAAAARTRHETTSTVVSGRESSPLVSHKSSFGTLGGGGGSTTRSRRRSQQQQASAASATATVIDVANVAFVEPQRHVSTSTSTKGRASVGAGASASASTAAAAAAGRTGADEPPPSGARAIPPDLAPLLDGTRCDDELCARFSMPWVDLQRILVQLGHSQPAGAAGTPAAADGEHSDDEAAMASHFHHSGYASAFQQPGFSAFSSIAGPASSGFTPRKPTKQQSQQQQPPPRQRAVDDLPPTPTPPTGAAQRDGGGGGGGGRSSAFSRTTTGADSASGWIRSSAGGGGGGSGGLADSATDALGSTAAATLMERESMNRGDYGRVKILLR